VLYIEDMYHVFTTLVTRERMTFSSYSLVADSVSHCRSKHFKAYIIGPSSLTFLTESSGYLGIHGRADGVIQVIVGFFCSWVEEG
jgi:hypothetical protein